MIIAMMIKWRPGQLVTLPLGLNEDEDLVAVPDLLQQPGQLGLLLVILADVHDLGEQDYVDEANFSLFWKHQGKSNRSNHHNQQLHNNQKKSKMHLEYVVVCRQVLWTDVDVDKPWTNFIIDIINIFIFEDELG